MSVTATTATIGTMPPAAELEVPEVLVEISDAAPERGLPVLFHGRLRPLATYGAASADAGLSGVPAADSIRVMERMILEEPWGWHPWQRLRVEVGADGVRRYSLKQYGFDEGQRLEGKPLAKPDRPAKAATPTAMTT